MTKPVKIIYLLVKALPETEDPAVCVYKLWKVDGEESRQDGPSLIFHDGGFEWTKNGLLHRYPYDGPTIFYPGLDGKKTIEYWLDGRQLEKSEDGEWLFVDSAEKVFL